MFTIQVSWQGSSDSLWVSCSSVEIIPAGEIRDQHFSQRSFPFQNQGDEYAKYSELHQQSLSFPNIMDTDLRLIYNQPSRNLWREMDFPNFPSYCLPELASTEKIDDSFHSTGSFKTHHSPSPPVSVLNELDFLSENFVTNGTFIPQTQANITPVQSLPHPFPTITDFPSTSHPTLPYPFPSHSCPPPNRSAADKQQETSIESCSRESGIKIYVLNTLTYAILNKSQLPFSDLIYKSIE